nr:hypothetical protein CFP56_77670 [Quercus suber]
MKFKKLGFDKDLISEEDVSVDHVTQLDSDQIMHVEALFPYEDHSRSQLSQKLSRQPRVNEADLVSVPITQNILGDITNALDKPNNTVTVELRKQKKKQGRISTDENMISSGLTRAKRLCEGDCNELPMGIPKKINKSWRFEQMWMDDEGCREVVEDAWAYDS